MSLILVGLDGTGIGSRCPLRPLLVDTNSPILVGLEVLGIRSHCLGDENYLTWYNEKTTVAVTCTGVFNGWD